MKKGGAHNKAAGQLVRTDPQEVHFAERSLT